MQGTLNSAAVILDRRPYREDSVLVSAYTRRFGKLSLVARGALKSGSKLAGHIEPATLADLMIIKGKGRDYIGSIITRRAYPNLRDDLNRLYFAGRALGYFNHLVGYNEADESLFGLLSDWLDWLDEHDATDDKKSFWPLKHSEADGLSRNNGEVLASFFIFKLLSALGYGPALSNCISCGREIKADGCNYFDPSGTLVCASCYKKRSGNNLTPVSNDALKIMRFISGNNISGLKKLKMNPKQGKEISRLATDFLRYYS